MKLEELKNIAPAPTSVVSPSVTDQAASRKRGLTLKELTGSSAPKLAEPTEDIRTKEGTLIVGGPAAGVARFLGGEVTNREGGDVEKLPYGTRTLGRIFQSIFGSKGALGLGKSPTEPIQVSQQARSIEEENMGLLGSYDAANKLIELAKNETDPVRKNALLKQAGDVIKNTSSQTQESKDVLSKLPSNEDIIAKTGEQAVNTALAGATSGGAGLGSGVFAKSLVRTGLGKILPEVLPAAEKTLEYGRGVIPRALEQGAASAGFNMASNIGEGKPIEDNALSAFLIGTLFPAGGAALSKGKEVIGSGFGKLGIGLSNTFLRATPKMFRYGKNPGRAIVEDVGGFNTFEEGLQKVDDSLSRRMQEAKDLVQEARAKNPVKTDSGSLRDILDPIDQKLAELKKAPSSNKAAIERLEGARSDIQNNIKKLDYVPPEDMIDLKRIVGGITKFTGNVSDDKDVNAALKQVYGRLMEKTESVVPGLGDVNGKIADLVTAKTALENRSLQTEAGKVLRFTGRAARIGAGILGVGTLNPALIATAIAEYGAEKAFESPAVRSRIATWLYNASPKERNEIVSKAPVFAGLVNKLFGILKKKPTQAEIEKEMEVLALPAPSFIEGKPWKGGKSGVVPAPKLPNLEDAQKAAGIFPKVTPEIGAQSVTEPLNKFRVFDKQKNLLGEVEAKDFYRAEDEAKKLFGKKYGSLMTKSLESDPLIQEARKYKSAEEFVKGQPVVYHGSPIPLKKFSNNKGGVFFTDSMEDASGFAGTPDNVYEGVLNFKKPLVIDAKGAKWDELNTKWGKSTQEIVSNAKKEGYDGVTFKNIVDNAGDTVEWGGQSTIHYAFKPEDVFLNESQLTDIWNEANKKK